MTRTRLLGAVLALLAALSMVAQPAAAEPGEVSAAEDFPQGCTTARGEADVQCGAQGRDHFRNAGHVPPVDACAPRTLASGATLTRILPDGPRRPDGSLAFVSGACVYLPPGYATSGLRYPVVYLLHGGGGDQADWHTFGGVTTVLDDAVTADPAAAVIAVMPDGRSGFWFDQKDGSYRNEAYVLEHLVPHIDRTLRTIGDRTARAVIGLSNGGFGALHLAAKGPDLFVAAGAMSANVGARSMTGFQTPEDPPFQELGAYYYGNTPTSLASNLDPVDLTIDVGRVCTQQGPSCLTVAVDAAFNLDNEAFVQALEDTGYTGTYEYRPGEGAHTWRSWTGWLRDRHLPFVLARLSDPRIEGAGAPAAVPTTFRYRSIAPAFDVFGYEVAVDRDVLEFLDLRDVREDGFEVQGSGTALITTAPRYAPGASYAVTGAGADPLTLVADGGGRLAIPVDLGPSHAHEQYSPEARAAEARGGYWTVRTVAITPDAAPVVPEGGPFALVVLAGAAALLFLGSRRSTPRSR